MPVSRAQETLFQGVRQAVPEAIALTRESLLAHGAAYDHWVLAYSGGKDSSATAAVVEHLVSTGQVPRPRRLTAIYDDTRLELPPLHVAAMGVLSGLRARGWDTHVVLPPIDHRLLVYVLGWGVPPPNRKFRWCTEKLKIKPADRKMVELRGGGEKFLLLHGMRRGESAARDARMAAVCSKDGGECGQGYFEQMSSEAVADTLGPVVHWRVCNVWDYLLFYADENPLHEYTAPIAAIYGMGEENSVLENDLRMGCVGCRLVTKDRSLDRVVRSMPDWAYLAPLLEVRAALDQFDDYSTRLTGTHFFKKDGTPAHKQGKPGVIQIKHRRRVLADILDIQSRVNAEARRLGRPEFFLINDEELRRINELHEANAYPRGWRGDEPAYGHIEHGVDAPLFGAN